MAGSEDIPRAQDQLFAKETSAREKYAALVVGKPDRFFQLFIQVVF